MTHQSKIFIRHLKTITGDNREEIWYTPDKEKHFKNIPANENQQHKKYRLLLRPC